MYNSWAYFIFLTYISPFPPLHLTNQAASTVHPVITLLSHDWVPWLTLEGAQKHLKTHLENVFICLEWQYVIGLTLQGKPTSQMPSMMFCYSVLFVWTAQANGGAAGGGVWRQAEGLTREERHGGQADERPGAGTALIKLAIELVNLNICGMKCLLHFLLYIILLKIKFKFVWIIYKLLNVCNIAYYIQYVMQIVL